MSEQNKKKKRNPPVNITQDMMNQEVISQLSELRDIAKSYNQLVEVLSNTIKNSTIGESALALCKDISSKGDVRQKLEKLRKVIKGRMLCRLREL